MDIRQLETFSALVEDKNFSAAAERLHLSQPTVSSHIRALEQELHTELIRRTTKMFEITPAGERLYNYAQKIIRLQQKALVELANAAGKELHIGTSSVPGQYLLPQALAEFHRIDPEIRFRIFYSDSLDIVQQVVDGGLDLGLVGTTNDAPCCFLPLADDELVIAVPNTAYYHQLQRENSPINILLQEPMILREDNSGTQQEANRHLAALGITLDQLNVIARMNDPAALLNCICQGLGISIISSHMAEPLARQGQLLIFPLSEYKLVRKLYLVYQERKYFPRIAQDFIEFLRVFEQSAAK